jgi:hypothetical protein
LAFPEETLKPPQGIFFIARKEFKTLPREALAFLEESSYTSQGTFGFP